MTKDGKAIRAIRCWLCVLIVGIGLLVGRNEVKAAEDNVLNPVSDFRIYGSNGEGLSLKWRGSDGADGYETQCSLSKEFPKRGRLDYKSLWADWTEAHFWELVAGKTYYVRVRAYKEVEDERIYSSWSKVLKIKVPRPISDFKVKSSDEGNLTFGWKRSSGADGYQLQWSSREDFPEEGLGKVETYDNEYTSVSIYGLTAGKYYYVRIRGYQVERDVKAHSRWSEALKVKVPKPISGFKVKSSKGKVLKAQWKSTKAVDGYELQCSRNKYFAGQIIKSEAPKNKLHEAIIKKNKLTAGKYYYVRIRGYKRQQGVKIYSKWSKTLKTKVKK